MERRSALRAWLDRPQSIPLRRALLQIHLWLALVLGVYIVVISVSGSAAVFRRELNAWLVPRTVDMSAGPRLTAASLETAVQGLYARYQVVEIREPARPERPVWLALERDGRVSERLFDPYAARDLGLAYPPTLRAVEWLVRVHDTLLIGTIGRRINGIGGAAVMVVALTGAVLWWPGRARWRRSVLPQRPSRTRRFAWHLHSALGLWCGVLVLVWAVTAVYFGFPEPFENAIDRFDTDPEDFERPGERLLLALIQLHFGRFGGLEVRAAWTVLGLVPAALFVTGVWMWWQRVQRRKAGSSVPGDNADQSA